MKPLALALLIIAVLVGAMFYSAATVNAFTYTGGRISSDTTCTQSDGPYRLTSALTIDNGATLTIEPGTIVDLYSYQIYVYGTLRCQGTSDNNIVLYSSRSASYSTFISFYSAPSWNESTGLGSIIENTVLSSVSVSIYSCSPKISRDYFTTLSMYSTALSVYNASSLIANNAFSSQGNGIYIDNSSPKVSNNFIKATNGYGIQVTSGANAYISSNNITGCSFGIYITNAVNTTITQNLITSNTYGINCNKNSTTIEYNTIANNSGYGILGTGAIRYNTIGNNTCGVAISSLPNNLTQNNIANNAVNLRLYPSNTSLTAPNNWWGTSDPVLINQAITVDHSSSTVSLMPTLSSPDPSAPDIGTLSLLPAPTPTPFATPSPVPSPPPTPTPSYYSYPTPTQPPSTPTPTAVPIEPTSTPTPTPTPLPTPTPTPKIVPGSPLSIGSATFEELLTQLDIMSIAQLVLIGLGIMWTIIISVTVAKRVVEKVIGKTKNQA